MVCHLHKALILAGFISSIAGPIWAQEDATEKSDATADDNNAEAAPVLKPPELTSFVEAAYPQSAQDAGIQGQVVLSLTIAADGSVTEAEVVKSLSVELDAAALEAGRALKFKPATRNGVAIAAKVQFPYIFELAIQEPEKGILEGVVRDGDSDTPIKNAELIITSADEARRVVTDKDGRFSVPDLPPGNYKVRILADIYGDVESTEEVGAGQSTNVTYRMMPKDSGKTTKAAYSARAVVKAPPREVTKRTIPREQLTKIPGTRGDALRSVELLPGVARPPGLFGAFIVRGSAPGDSQVFLDSMPLPLLYHFGGLTSVYNSRLLERIDFIPGNFSARYGRKMGGILEVATRDPATDGFHGALELSVVDASILLEAPIGEHFSFAIAARRSLIDAVFEAVIPEDAFNVLAAPVYYDYELIAVWKPNKRHRVRLQFYGADDRLRFLFEDAIADNPSVRGTLNLAAGYNLIHAQWDWKIDQNWSLDVDFQTGPTVLDFSLGPDLGFRGDFFAINTRAEAIGKIHRAATLRFGLDISTTPVKINFRGPQPPQSEGAAPNNFAAAETVFLTEQGVAYRPAAYVELDTRLIDPLQIMLGMRVDYFKEIKEWTFDPRLLVAYELTDTFKVKGGIGTLFTATRVF